MKSIAFLGCNTCAKIIMVHVTLLKAALCTVKIFAVYDFQRFDEKIFPSFHIITKYIGTFFLDFIMLLLFVLPLVLRFWG